MNTFEDFYIEKGNTQATVNDKLKTIRAFLKFYDVKLPNWIKKKDDRKKWNPLSKEDLKFIIGICDNYDKAVLTFMLSTGFRRLDVINFTIGDFMEATKEYHDFVDVDDFIDNAPDDMIGYWDTIPNKNKKRGIPCQTFNSRESSNLILQHLRKIKNEYIPRKNKKEGLSLKLEKTDALFGSREKMYKGHLSKSGLSQKVESKYPRFKDWKIRQIDEKIRNKEISEADRESEIDKITNLSCHDLRKYFINTIDTYSKLDSNRAKLVMEGHKSKIATDPNYIAKQKKELKEGYMNALPYLTIIDGVDLKLENETLRLKDMVIDLEEQLKAKNKQIAEMDRKHSADTEELRERVTNIEKGMPQFKYRNPLEYRDIKMEIVDCVHDLEDEGSELSKKLKEFSPDDIIVLRELAFTIVVDDGEEVDKAVKKALIRLIAQSELLEEGRKFVDELVMCAAKLGEYNVMVIEKLEELDLWEKEERDEITKNLVEKFMGIVDGVLFEDITEDYVLSDIEDFI